MTLPDGMIEVDSPFGVEIGFTSDGFKDYSYLWGDGKDTIIVSMISSKVKGAFSMLMRNIESRGYVFQIPTPSTRMREIGRKQKWVMGKTMDERFGVVEYLTNERRKKGRA